MKGNIRGTGDRVNWKEDNPIRRWRKGRGWGLIEMAQRVGCSTSSLQRWEAGHVPSFLKLRALAAVMGKNWMELLDEYMRWLDGDEGK